MHDKLRQIRNSTETKISLSFKHYQFKPFMQWNTLSIKEKKIKTCFNNLNKIN